MLGLPPIPGVPSLPGARGRAAARLTRAAAGRTVVVTGASSGIGRAVARRLGGAGAHVVLVSRRQEELEAAAGEVRERGGTASVHAADLSETADAERVATEILAAHGTVHVLVNNAGRSIRRTVAESEGRFHDFERTMALNYFGALSLTLAFLPVMREQGDGHVVNISTMGVQVAPPRFASYVASKAALDAFMRCAAPELREYGVHVTTVHMPLVRTPMIRPTAVYRRMPALTPGQAAGMICDAIVDRPRTVSLPWGTGAEVAHALAPGPVERIKGALGSLVR